MKTAIYTAVTGGFDDLKGHVQIPDTDWVAYTSKKQRSPYWEERDGNTAMTLGPRMQAKWYKMFVRFLEHDLTIWVDASVRVTDVGFVDMIDEALGVNSIGFLAHPERDCIYDEALASLDFPKYRNAKCFDQAGSYWAAGHPRHWGLWCGTIIAHRGSNKDRERLQLVDRLTSRWWREMSEWGCQDQISLPFVLRNSGIPFATIPGNLYNSSYFHVDFAGHKSNL